MKWWRVAVALLFLHLLAVVRWPWENTAWRDAVFTVSPDLVVVLALAISTALALGCSRRWTTGIAHAAAVLILLVPLYRFGHTIYPANYGRRFDVFDDVREVPMLAHLLTHEYGPWAQVAVEVGAVVVLLALYAGVFLAARVVLRAAVVQRFAAATLLVCQAIVLLGWVAQSLDSGGPVRIWREGMLGALGRSAVERLRTPESAMQRAFAERASAQAAELEIVPRDLTKLGRADLHVLCIESYGRGLFAGWTRQRFADAGRRFDALLAKRGWAACSTFIEPSVRGGSSALAHAEFLSGIRIDSRRLFHYLLQSKADTLPRMLGEAGYVAYNVQPGMPEDWPGGKFYGFTHDVFQQSFGYDGTKYHWGLMPDQFALQHVLETAVRKADAPLFVFYVSVTSHSPFSMIPPYVEPWAKASDAQAFRQPATRYDISWMNYVGHPEAEGAYAEAIHYSLRTMVGYSLELVRPSLVVIFGDHQPPAMGALTQNDPSFDVPIHLLSNEAALLEAFIETGFSAGFMPPQAARSFPSRRFLFRFLKGLAK